MRHLVVIALVVCAVIGNGWAQNQDRARYAPPQEYDGESTRAPRPAPARGVGQRRQRTTKAPEVPVVEDDLKSLQPPESTRTTARRVPQRGNPRQVAPPPPPPVPVVEPISLYSAPGSDIPQSPPTDTEGRPQGTRRRRPKKRRKPQAEVPKADDQSEKVIPTVPENNRAVISELLNEDRKRTEDFQSNTQLRNTAPGLDSNPNYHPERPSWEQPDEQPQRNTAGSQYFRPQSATNRLPVDDSEQVRNSGYLESSPVIPNVDSSNQYVPKEPSSGVRNEASYVPILTPIRVQGASRLSPEAYPPTRNRESARPLPSDRNVPYRTHDSRSPDADTNQVIRNTGLRPIHNTIPQPNEPAIPIRGHSDVRLPEEEQPIHSPDYVLSNFDSAEDLPLPLEPNVKVSDENEKRPNPTNRLPNSSEIHYDSVYPEFLENPQRISGRRQEPDEASVRRTHSSSPTPRRGSGTKPQEYDNDAEIDRQQASQYRPPLQRTISRHRPEDLDEITRSRAPQSPSTVPPRGRGSSRYQTTTDDIVSERTSSLTRHPVESADSPSRTRSASTSESTTRTRGSQRYAPETVESAPRTSSRRQPENADTPPRRAQYTPTVPARVLVDEINEQRVPPHSSRTFTPPPTAPPQFETAKDQDDYGSIRNTLRSRPQYEARVTEPINSYEESVEDSNAYDNEYQQPRQPITRARTIQRPPVIRQEPPQPEYQQPRNRQQTRPEPDYEPPQNPRPRQQPQYQAPQNSRTDYRQASPRQNVPNPRQQSNPRHQDPETPAAKSRSSGGSNFKCPQPFGFFADPVQCDKYYECRDGTAEMTLCTDGLAFNEASSPNFLRCDSLRDVDCKSRPKLQEPQPTKNCPRRFGLFHHESDCTKFWNCVDGVETEVKCPPGLVYNDELGTCDWADLVESSCKTEDLVGFTCPEPTAHDLMDGVYSRYPHPDNCQLHFTCIKGADGLRRPRMLSCNEGHVFDPATASCTRPEEVPGCEEFYGPPPPPRKKPAPRQPAPRQPEPEEELIEDPTPRPRRRGSNRRARS